MTPCTDDRRRVVLVAREILDRPDDHRRLAARRQLAEVLEEREAVHLRHLQVEDDGERRLSLAEAQAVDRALDAGARVAELRERCGHQPQRSRIVVDHQHVAVACRCGRRRARARRSDAGAVDRLREDVVHGEPGDRAVAGDDGDHDDRHVAVAIAARADR